jgi:hypothetical protein
MERNARLCSRLALNINFWLNAGASYLRALNWVGTPLHRRKQANRIKIYSTKLVAKFAHSPLDATAPKQRVVTMKWNYLGNALRGILFFVLLLGLAHADARLSPSTASPIAKAPSNAALARLVILVADASNWICTANCDFTDASPSDKCRSTKGVGNGAGDTEQRACDTAKADAQRQAGGQSCRMTSCSVQSSKVQ